MEILKNPLLWSGIIIFCALIFRSMQAQPTIIRLCHFSINDIGYGFKVISVDKENELFLIEYIPDVHLHPSEYRANTCWYKTDGVSNEVLTPGEMFVLLKDGDAVKFQKVEIGPSKMDDLSVFQRTYIYVDEYFSLPAQYLQLDSGYVHNETEYGLKNL